MGKYLTCYDYGHGGIWRYVLAESKEQIEQLYPELDVVDTPPKWIRAEDIERMNRNIVDIQNSDDKFFKAVLSERKEHSVDTRT